MVSLPDRVAALEVEVVVLRHELAACRSELASLRAGGTTPPSWRLPQWPLRAWRATLPLLATPLLSSPCWLPMPRRLRWCAHSLGFLLLPRAMPHPVPPVLVLVVHYAGAWLPRSTGPLLATLLPPL